MTTYKTGNPIGSTAVKDLYDNAENLDEVVNSSTKNSITDRLGREILTWKGITSAGTGDTSVAVDAAARAVDAAGRAETAEAIVDATNIQNYVAQAEAARDAAFINADVYATIAEGRDAVAVGEQFQVLSENGLEYIRYRKESTTVTTEVGRIKTSSGVDQGLSEARELSYSLTHDLTSQFGDEILTRKGVPLSGSLTAYDSSDIIPVYQGQVIRIRLQIYDVNIVAHSFMYRNKGGSYPSVVSTHDTIPEREGGDMNGPVDLYYTVPPHVTGMRFWSMNSTDSRYVPEWFRVEIWNPKSMFDPVNWNLDTFLSKALRGHHAANTSTYSTLITAVKEYQFVAWQGLGGTTRKTAFLDENYDLLSESTASSGNDFAPEGAAYLQIVTTNRTHSSYTPEMEEEFFIKTGTPYENEQSSVERRVTALEQAGGSSTIVGEYLPNIHLKTVRELTFTDGSDRLAFQYLWYDKDYRFYISDSLRGLRHYVFTFDPAQFHGLTDPRWFSMNFDPAGNIVCVYRTEGSTEGTRLNPIVLVKSNAYAPAEVTFPADQAPAGWIQNCGFLCTEDSVFFVEYIRGGVQYAHTWKVTMPVTDEANWTKVQTFSIGHDVEGMKRIKHMHNVDRDPFTGHIYTSSGDGNSEAAIFVSKDGGDTFSTVLEGSQKYCRLLNFVWTKDFVYWATDAAGTNHAVFKVPRGTDGVIDVSGISDLHMFPAESAPTYASIYLPKIRAIVFLGRYDGANDGQLPIDVLDLTDDTFHTIATVPPSPGNVVYGFRCETFEYIPRGNDIPCGFSTTVGPGGYANFIGVLGSKGGVSTRPNNLILTVERVGSEFTMSISTVV